MVEETRHTQIQYMIMDNFVTVLMSAETIKPSSSKPSEPFKLSFIDQLMPTTYVPLILFYPQNQLSMNPNFSSTLKLSLSQTLSTFFPFSGRLKDNLFVHNFEEGIPFSETKVSIDLSEFLQNPQLHKLNHFLPTEPFTQVSLPTESLPILYAQLNNFQCGGIALAICFSHKICDVDSISRFLRKWSEYNINFVTNPSNDETITPDFVESSLRFPPFNSSPSHYVSVMEKFFFEPRKRTTKRFVFDSNAISSLQEKATTESETGVNIRPTRVKTLSSFIWKGCVAASSASISSTPRMSLSILSMNIRKKAEPSLPECSLGNLLWFAIAAYDIVDSAENESRTSSLQEFVGLTNQSADEVNSEFLKTLEGEKGKEVAVEFLEAFDEMYSTNPELFVFSSWVNFGIKELDFGFGMPAWVSLMGEVGPALGNLIIFSECCNSDGIEAWITLDNNLMDILEHDPEFLKFATPNPPIFPKPN